MLSEKCLSLMASYRTQDGMFVSTYRARCTRCLGSEAAVFLFLGREIPVRARLDVLKGSALSIVSVLFSSTCLCGDFCKHATVKTSAVIMSFILRMSFVTFRGQIL